MPRGINYNPLKSFNMFSQPRKPYSKKTQIQIRRHKKSSNLGIRLWLRAETESREKKRIRRATHSNCKVQKIRMCTSGTRTAEEHWLLIRNRTRRGQKISPKGSLQTLDLQLRLLVILGKKKYGKGRGFLGEMVWKWYWNDIGIKWYIGWKEKQNRCMGYFYNF